ncbi:UNVERIFIED_CONTAM: hypothetical protein K2H54_009858 [Gekko kuhli]
MDYGANLLTITNRFEQAYVNSLIYSWEDEYFWTALQDINETGSFHWLSGDEVMYTHWNRNQPGKDPPLRLSRGVSVRLCAGAGVFFTAPPVPGASEPFLSGNGFGISLVFLLGLQCLLIRLSILPSRGLCFPWRVFSRW